MLTPWWAWDALIDLDILRRNTVRSLWFLCSDSHSLASIRLLAS